ncbi:MAG TPA: PAS domain S-box protein [Microvirga sp.]|jgi:PAS domain S-box-containing protein|nr:PAS domain S-box protein [Microvirga sp.]
MMQGGGFTIRQCLMAFAAALLAPGLIFAGVLLWGYVAAERSHAEQEARDAAHRAVAAVDRELTGLQAAAQALAASASLREGRYEAFQQQALATLKVWSPEKGGDIAIVVRDVSGQQVVNTRLPWGTPLPKGANLQVDQEVIATKRPIVQDLFTGATANRPITSVRVPAVTEGQVTHILSMALEPKWFAEVLQSQNLPVSWIAALIDRTDRVIARTREHEAFVGTLAPEAFRTSQRADEGVWQGRNLEGAPTFGAYARSALSGWRVFVGVPVDVLNAPLYRSLWALAGLSVLLLALSFLLALRFGRRISDPVQRLAETARALGTGGTVPPPSGGLAEIDEVGRVLAVSAAELQAREAAVRQSGERLRATHENAAVGIVEVDRDGRFLSVNEARCRLTGHSREELIGRPFADPVVNGEPNPDFALFGRQVEGALDSYTIENRFTRKDGTGGWVRVSSTAVRGPDGAFLYAVRVVEDITERKQAEERQKLLIDELNHRVKNTLATVQSLAWQSARKGGPPEEAQQRFQERLLSLSRTHNLLNETSWEGASLRTILQTELEPLGLGEARFRLDGPDLDLPPKVAVVLGMVIHELTTNAMKYGAFSRPEGQVAVEWDGRADGTLRLTWRETGGPPVAVPQGRGFGSRLIEQAVTRELDGHVEMQFAPEGLRCRVTVPLGRPLDQVA